MGLQTLEHVAWCGRETKTVTFTVTLVVLIGLLLLGGCQPSAPNVTTATDCSSSSGGGHADTGDPATAQPFDDGPNATGGQGGANCKTTTTVSERFGSQ